MHPGWAMSYQGVDFEPFWAQALSGLNMCEHLPHGESEL
jgi:hypothetical protein